MKKDKPREFTNRELYEILQTILANKPVQECPVKGLGVEELFDSMKKDIDAHPGAVIMMPELDYGDEESEAIQDFMFDGMNFDDIP